MLKYVQYSDGEPFNAGAPKFGLLVVPLVGEAEVSSAAGEVVDEDISELLHTTQRPKWRRR